MLTSAGISASCFDSRLVFDLALGFSSTYGGNTDSSFIGTSSSSAISGFSTAETLRGGELSAYTLACYEPHGAYEVGVFLMKWVSKVFCDSLGGDLLPTLPLLPLAILVLAAFPFLISVAPGWSLDLASYEECGF